MAKKKSRATSPREKSTPKDTSDAPALPHWIEGLSPEARKWIGVIALTAIGLLSILSLAGLAGMAGSWINASLGVIFGYTKYLFPPAVITLAYLAWRRTAPISPLTMLGGVLMLFAFNGLWHLAYDPEVAWRAVMEGRGGGIIGFALADSLWSVMGFWGALIVIVALLVSSVVILFHTPLSRMLQAWREGAGEEDEEEEGEDEEMAESEYAASALLAEIPQFARKDATPHEEEPAPPTLAQEPIVVEKAEQMEVIKPKKKAMAAKLSLDLLSDRRYDPTSGDIKRNKEIIEQTLKTFGIPVEMGEVNVGPAFTQYTFKPAEGIHLSKITSLYDNLALALAAPGKIRIEAPIPGKSLVGIEVPNPKVAMVTLRELFETEEFKKRKNNLCMAFGKDVKGKGFFPSLIGMPHMLIAGQSGSGKSVCLHTIINSLLFQNTPEELRFIIVDPKRVDLVMYNDIPHLLTPIVNDMKKAILALRWTITEMERRFQLLHSHGKRDLISYNEKIEEKIPYIVLVIDEYNELLMASNSEVEPLIVRIAQLGRAAGIHLILATQRPSAAIVTGTIKANISTRVAFALPSAIDSRTILDSNGAEDLVGKGDMLYISAEMAKPVRLQGVYVSDDEISAVTGFLKESGEPVYEEGVTEKTTGSGVLGSAEEDDDDDPLLSDAKDVIIQARKASASLLQRRLKVGYSRASRILDILERQGVIGPGEGAKPREVLIGTPEDLDIAESQEWYETEEEESRV